MGIIYRLMSNVQSLLVYRLASHTSITLHHPTKPLAVSKPRGLFEDGDAAAVILDQVVIRGKYVGNLPLDWERGEGNF
jgi:hypothetical protein